MNRDKCLNHYLIPLSTLPLIKNPTTKPNPTNPKFAPMILYPLTEVRERSYRRWGGRDGVKKERLRRTTEKFEKKRKAVEEALSLSQPKKKKK